MFSPQKDSLLPAPQHPRRSPTRLLIPPAVAALTLSLTGCANTGTPKPPTLALPKLATHLTAQRVADHVLLTWDTPSETTDELLLHGPIEATICRETPAPATSPTPCPVVGHLPVHPGTSRYADALPPALATGPARLLTYRVELFNPRKHSAGPSTPVYAAAGLAPAAAGPITLATRRNGVLITWKPPTPPATGALVEIQRTLISASPNAKPTAKQAPEKKTKHPQPAEPNLLTAGTASGADPGGTIDRTLTDGETVSYVAQRVATVALTVPASTPPTAPAKSGPHLGGKTPKQEKPGAATETKFEIRGEPSPAQTLVFHDTAPPAPPTGLAAIPSETDPAPSIDLSWEPSPEADVAGYAIYRAEVVSSSEPPQPDYIRLNPEPVPGPAYRDLAVRRGHTYRYRVTAIDERHNESAPSSPITEPLHP